MDRKNIDASVAEASSSNGSTMKRRENGVKALRIVMEYYKVYSKSSAEQKVAEYCWGSLNTGEAAVKLFPLPGDELEAHPGSEAAYVDLSSEQEMLALPEFIMLAVLLGAPWIKLPLSSKLEDVTELSPAPREIRLATIASYILTIENMQKKIEREIDPFKRGGRTIFVESPRLPIIEIVDSVERTIHDSRATGKSRPSFDTAVLPLKLSGEKLIVDKILSACENSSIELLLDNPKLIYIDIPVILQLLPELKVLHIRNTPESVGIRGATLGRIKLPCLEEFELTSSIPLFKELVEGDFSGVRRLICKSNLIFDEQTKENLILFLAKMPKLEELAINIGFEIPNKELFAKISHLRKIRLDGHCGLLEEMRNLAQEGAFSGVDELIFREEHLIRDGTVVPRPSVASALLQSISSMASGAADFATSATAVAGTASRRFLDYIFSVSSEALPPS